MGMMAGVSPAGIAVFLTVVAATMLLVGWLSAQLLPGQGSDFVLTAVSHGLRGERKLRDGVLSTVWLSEGGRAQVGRGRLVAAAIQGESASVATRAGRIEALERACAWAISRGSDDCDAAGLAAGSPRRVGCGAGQHRHTLTTHARVCLARGRDGIDR